MYLYVHYHSQDDQNWPGKIPLKIAVEQGKGDQLWMITCAKRQLWSRLSVLRDSCGEEYMCPKTAVEQVICTQRQM